MLVSRQSRNQKKSINKIVLPGGAAEMRLAGLFQSEELHPADHRSTAFATRDTSRATRTDTEQHSKLFREIVTSTNLLTPKEEQRHRRGSHPK
jgi:hypothetical protein